MDNEKWKDSLLERLSLVERRLYEVEQKNAVDEVHRQNVEKRLGGIEDNLKWLVRLVVGALLLALVSFLLSGGVAPSV